MTTNLDEVIDYLKIVEKKGLLNNNTAQGRRTACTKLFSVLDDDQRNVEYVRDHLDVIKTQFQNLNKDVLGQTVDIYVNRAQLALDGFAQWSKDRGAYERELAGKGSRTSTEKKERSAKAEKAEPAPKPEPKFQSAESPDSRVVKFPLPSGFEVTVTIPREDLTTVDIRRIAWGLMSYTKDFTFDQGASPRSMFPMLEPREDGVMGR